jgi:hypothetical protein
LTATESLAVIARLADLGSTRAGLTEWVHEYFELLDVNGSFAFAWTQAANEDEEIRTAGMKRHLGLCKRLGEQLAESAGKPSDEPVGLGLVAFSAMERAWSYCHLYGSSIDRLAIEAQIAQMLWGAARQPRAVALVV